MRKWFAVPIIVGLLCGCFIPQVYDTTQHSLLYLPAEDLRAKGLAFITPTAITGQEEEKQAVALLFTEVLKKERPAMRCVSLPEALNALTEAGLADDYKRLLQGYRETGIFDRAILRKVGEATKTGYVAQLKLMIFSQGSQDRFGALGLRMIMTKSAHLRLFLQIWNVEDGLIAWEGVQEMHYAVDTVTENSVALKTAMERAAHAFISRLP